jgi:1,4-alpha-glucan branching enzyme
MDFVLTLHSHLPWVLHHGRWPHGSDWLCEAATDTYLPLVLALEALERQGIPSPVTLGLTPVLANQLAHHDFAAELEAFFAQRLEAAREAETDFTARGESELAPVARFWRVRLERLRRAFRRLDGDLLGALRGFAARGTIELLSSAATHGFLPLLARDESVRLQLQLGHQEHIRLLGVAPSGLWLPECAYRGAGPWRPHPAAPTQDWRSGLEEQLEASGYSFFYVDAHMAAAGAPLGLYGEREFVDGVREPARTPLDVVAPRSPYRAYGVGSASVTALVRDPQSSLRVWSRHEGYPGDGAYLEFHKIRWPGGLKCWRVTGVQVDLGAKEPYDFNIARARAYRHAGDYAALLVRLAAAVHPLGGEVIVAPFDTELFGHWWFEGVDFLSDLYRRLARQGTVRPTTAGAHLAQSAGSLRQRIQLADGSWGANGDYSRWLNAETIWTWRRLWALEERFWSLAQSGLAAEAPAAGSPHATVWRQATRELLLAQSSDWQFIIATGAAADYAERRFREHCDNLDELLRALEDGTPEAVARGADRAQALYRLNDLFPDPLPAVVAALGAPRREDWR